MPKASASEPDSFRDVRRRAHLGSQLLKPIVADARTVWLLCNLTDNRNDVSLNKTRNRELTRIVPSDVVENALSAWKHGDIFGFAEYFHDAFTFADRALDVEFTDRESLIQFLTKTLELFSDTERTANIICSTDEMAVGEWIVTARETVPFIGGLAKLPIQFKGVSVVQIKEGKIIRWSDYYDQLRSRRFRISEFFTDWVEL